MLEIAAKMPPGVLVDGDNRALTQALLRSGGARFVAQETDLLRKDGVISGWREAMGAVEAVTAVPNTGNSRFDSGPPAGLVCEDGVNCGFVLPEFAPVVERFTIAVIYSSGGEARTLASVFTGQSNNMIFLSEGDGRLLAKDKQSTVEVSLPIVAQDKPRLVLLGFDGRVLRLADGANVAMVEGRVPAMLHPGDFFIGCRSNRPGLAKTLGKSRLHEVMFWPDRALLGSDADDDRAALAALSRYHRWAF